MSARLSAEMIDMGWLRSRVRKATSSKQAGRSRIATEGSPSMENLADSKEKSKSGKHPHRQSRLWPQPTKIVGTGQTNPNKIAMAGLVNQATGTPHHSTAGTTQTKATSTKQLGAGTMHRFWGRCWAQSWLFYSWPGQGHINLTMSSCHSLVASLPLP